MSRVTDPPAIVAAAGTGPLAGVRAGGRVVVAMSGGVDSSVVAATLKHRGYEVIGITLQLYDHGQATARKGACCAGQDIHDARRVANQIGIPHYVFDYESRFKASVIQTFAESYLAGETPVPCVACNQTVKFTDLLGAARELGAEALATGHYVERREGPDGPELYRASDSERDQSYFLFATTRDQLNFLRFPLGGLPKAEVRALAEAFELPVAEKPDSQDICFVPSGRYADVIERLHPGAASAGDIVHIDGRVLGRHDGIIHFTVGQRKGLGIATGEPLFVVALDPVAHKVVVGPRDCLRRDRIVLRNVNWLGGDTVPRLAEGGQPMYVRVRSAQQPLAATLSAEPRGIDDRMCVTLKSAEHGIAAGQACVFYADGSSRARVLGGGWIAATEVSATQMKSSITPTAWHQHVSVES